MLFSELYKEPRKRYFSYSNSNFTVTETLNIFATLKRNAIDGYIVCDGAGDISFSISQDSTNFGDEIILKENEKFPLTYIDTNKVKVTYIANSSYRIFCI